MISLGKEFCGRLGAGWECASRGDETQRGGHSYRLACDV